MAPSLYIIVISPVEPTRVKGLFQFGAGSASSVLEEPGSFRYAGWDLTTLDRARIRDGEFVEVANGERKIIRLYEDGTLVIRGLIDEGFLGWGTRDQTFEANPKLHALASIEFTTSAVHLYQTLISFLEPKPGSVKVHLEITNGKVGNRFLYTEPYRVNAVQWGWGDKDFALTKPNPTSEFIVSTTDVAHDPNKAAFELVEHLFRLFSVPTERIPYIIESEGIQRVNVDEIVAIR